jgi:hypothetical protein
MIWVIYGQKDALAFFFLTFLCVGGSHWKVDEVESLKMI